MAEPAEITLEPMIEGDTWQGITSIGPVTFVDENEDPVAVPGVIASVELDFSRGPRKPVLLHCTSAVSVATHGQCPILIGDAAAWEMSIPPMPYDLFNLPAGTWIGDLKVIYNTNPGTKITLYRITQVVTP
jgi:hypothetical protein